MSGDNTSEPAPDKQGWYAFCMDFSPLVSEIPPSGGIRRPDRGEKNPSHMENHTKCIFSHTLHFSTLIMLNTLHKVEDHENHVRWIYLTTVLKMGESQKYARNFN